jgi:hypothetical protein
LIRPCSIGPIGQDGALFSFVKDWCIVAKESRLYSLFHKIDGKYVRQSPLAYKKSLAVRVFQSRLIDGCLAGLEICLRPVKAELSDTERMKIVSNREESAERH